MRNLLAMLLLAVASADAYGADWPMYGFDVSQSRFNQAEKGIDAGNVTTLQQLWFKATGGPVSTTSAVVGGTVYIGSWDHKFYALDAETGSERWTVTVTTPQGDAAGFPGIQSSAAVANGLVYFGDSCGYLHAYPADGTGAAPTATTTRSRGCGSTGTEAPGFPVDLAGNLPVTADAAATDLFSSPIPYTPKSGANQNRALLYIGAASHHDQPCIHGALFAVDALSGAIVWRFDVVDVTKSIGGGVWSTPAIDATNDLVYVDTGDCVSNASNGFSESIIALDASCSGVSLDPSCSSLAPVEYPPATLTPGNPVWVFQSHPAGEIADFDFGSSPNVITDSNGNPILVGAGSKDGSYYAVKAGPSGGDLAWTTRLVNEQTSATTVTVGSSIGSALGGFSGSTGFADGRVFGTTVSGPEFELALDGKTGALQWLGPDAVSSLSPVGIAGGLVFAGDNLGLLKARDAATGLPLSAFSTGGVISGGPVIADGKVFVSVGLLGSLAGLPAGIEKTGIYALAPSSSLPSPPTLPGAPPLPPLLPMSSNVPVLAAATLFVSPVLVIPAGTTVEWQNAFGSLPHTVTSAASLPDALGGKGDGRFRFPLPVGGPNATYTFNDAGVFPYFCEFHFAMGMVGTVIVVGP
jgi:polyvinyl alcohol dehydrogenase (cytochrome)